MAGSTWPDLVAGRKAKASEVESKFDWLEGSILPMNSGSTTDLAYDLGSETKRWRQAYVQSINATSTAGGVAIGTTTADAGALLELAGTKALILPRLSTTQRDALTGKDGMLIYNSTTAQYQIYKSGLAAWSNIGGTVFRTNPALQTSTTAVVTTTVWSVASGGGRLHGVRLSGNGATQGYAITIDGSVIFSGVVVGSLGSIQADGSGYSVNTTTAVLAPSLNLDFATSASIALVGLGGNTVTVNFVYSSIV